MNNEAKNLLRTCAENLLNAVNCLENPQGLTRSGSENQTANDGHSPNQGHTSSQVLTHNQLSQTPRQAETTSQLCNPSLPPRRTPAEEHRSLFGYRPPCATAGRNKPPQKRRMVTTSTGESISVPVRNTWTRTFVCLTKRNAITPPTTVDKMNMALAGLVEQNITFTKNGNSDHVHKKIMEAFPMLAEGGGYEILRAGQRTARQLMVIAIPPGGYTVTYLKSTIASAKGYIRPLQRDIVLKSTTLTDPDQSQVGGSCHTKLLINVVPFFMCSWK